MLVRRASLLVLLVFAAALVAVGCGDDDSSSNESSTPAKTTTDAPSGDAQVLEVGVIAGELKFDKTKLEAKAGEITIRLDNTDSIPHNVALDDEVGPIVAEDVSEITVTLEPGTYTVVCTPHAGAGMELELTVT